MTTDVAPRSADGLTRASAHVSATAEIPLWKGLALQALINLTPERHREPEDNSVTNYTSIDLLYRF